MVSASSSRRSPPRWSPQRLKATVLSNVWPEMLVFTSFATAVVLVHEKTSISLAIGAQLLTVAGIVLGLVISFRTTSAYERYQDGSELWTDISTASLAFARLIWIHVPNERVLPDNDTVEPVLNVIIEKKTMINLIHAFGVSVKHLLRDEPGVFYEDLYPSVAFLPKFPTPMRHPNDILPIWHVQPGRPLTSAVLRRRDTLFGMVESKMPPLKPSALPPDMSIYDHLPLLKVPRWGVKKAVDAVETLQVEMGLADEEELRPKKKRRAYSEISESTVPLEIYLVLSNYIGYLMKNELAEGTVLGEMNTALLSMNAALGHLDRVCNTPLPFAYQAHLRMSAWLYMAFLPFQLVRHFGYYAILVTALVTLLICGFLELGKQIENPFNYDMNDLDLDRFCDDIKAGLLEITTQPELELSSYVFSSQNQPFAPHDRRTADALLASVDAQEGALYTSPQVSRQGMEGIRHTLLRNWAEVNRLTRK